LLLLFALSLLFSYSQSFNEIAGGQQSVWFGAGEYEEMAIENAGIYDPNFFHYRFNAFDNAFELLIDYYYQDLYPYEYPTAEGSTVEEIIDKGTYSYDYQFYFSPTLAVARAFISFTAKTSSISLNVTMVTESGAFPTLVFGDYSGNGIFDVTDEWVVIGDGNVNNIGQYDGVPYVTYSVFGPGATVKPIAAFLEEDFIVYTFTLNLAPGETQSLLFFDQLSLNPQSAITSAATFTSISKLQQTDLLFDLSSAQLGTIVNWGLKPARKVSSYTGICDFASEVKNRVSQIRTNQRHSFSQPWRC